MERRLVVVDERGEHAITVLDDGRVLVDDVALEARIIGDGEVRLGANGSTVAWVAPSGDRRWVFLNGSVYEFEIHPAGRRRRRAVSGHSSLSAPMPATVIRVEVLPGAHVRRGDTLVILEAMKMELPIRADTDGMVTSVTCKPGDLVQPGVALVEIE
jgi:3-methylcrotonyl-CoA carboxylase alpha subunit